MPIILLVFSSASIQLKAAKLQSSKAIVRRFSVRVRAPRQYLFVLTALKQQPLIFIKTTSQERQITMKKPLIFAAAAMASVLSLNASSETSYEYAQVLNSTPIYRIVEISEPREQCWEEERVIERSSRRGDSNTPVIVSTILGGAIGNAVGSKKSNQRVGAVLGAVLGHAIGRDIVRGSDDQREQTVETVESCETVYEQVQEERLIGYKVTYLYQGQERSVRADGDPGEQIKVRISVEPVL
ncbi:MAG: hypothetical protein ACI9E4_000686 [Pseudohongiellaceae bacterium]|jgi:uncharacterized protein YcfJ